MNKIPRKWVSTNYLIPKDGQKVYYFCESLGIFRGEYHYIDSSYANPNKFSSNHGVLDADDVSYWMPYDHAFRDMIPLPPDYNKIPLENLQSMENSGEEIKIPSTDLNFTATASVWV